MSDAAPDAAPSSPLAALLGELATQAQSKALRVLLAALDHVLDQQSWARERLARHAGSTIRICVDAGGLPLLRPPDLLATVDVEGFLQPAEPGATPAATLVLEPSADAFLSVVGDGPDAIARHVRIDGEAALAATLGELARHLRWDAEEDFSRVVGDVAAHRFAQFLRDRARDVADLGRRGHSAAVQFTSEGRTPAVGRQQARRLREGAEALDVRVRALEARVARLRA